MKIIRVSLVWILGISSFISCNGQQKMKNEKITLKSNMDKVSYSIGVNIASSLRKQGLDSVNVDILAQAMKDVINKDSLLLDEAAAMQTIQSYLQAGAAQKGQGNEIAGKKFLEENKSKPGVITLASGLQYMILKEGTGPKPKLTDKVTTHYHGTLIDGKVFDSSVERGQPASFPVNGVIAGWTEALQLMPVGSKWKLFIPSQLAYGERGAGQMIGPNATLIFEVELLSIDTDAK